MIFNYSDFQLWVIIEIIILSGVAVYLIHKVKKLERKIKMSENIEVKD